MYLLHIVLLQFSVSGYIYLITLKKWLFAFVFIPTFIVLCVFSYWTYTQDLSITNALIHVILETTPSVAMEMISLPFILFLCGVLALTIFINRLYNGIKPVKTNRTFLLISGLSIISFNIIENYRYDTFRTRLPYSLFYGITNYLEKDDYIFNEIPDDVFSNVDSLKVVLVLGETVRADHLQINGYLRATTPILNATPNIVSFKNIYTPHTYTGSSLPRIITDANVKSKALNPITSVFDVYKRCDYSTFWIGNQELERSYESIARTNNKVVLVDSLRSVLSFNKALDEELLKPLIHSFSESKSSSLHTVHMMGSHWWYENRYTQPYRVFKPVIESKHLPSLSEESIINSYDNTLVYLDSFLKNMIEIQDTLKEPTILIYISDHGEALGEKGRWLHAQDNDAAKNPAMLMWFSESFRLVHPDKVNAIYKNKNNHYSTDIIYHSLLDLIQVKNFEYDRSLSVFCVQE